MKHGKQDVDTAELTLRTTKTRPQAVSRAWMLALVVMAGCSVGFAVKAYTRGLRRDVPAIASTVSVARSTSPTLQQSRSLDYTRLARQPEVDRMRRILGRRFLSAGRELSVLTGTLSLAGDTSAVRIARAQQLTGELVSLSIVGSEASLEWSDTAGAISGGRAATTEQRRLIERIALDSADQFILAQLRGASYRMVAQNVAPKGAADLEDYRGPAWDVIRIAEPESSADKRPVSGWRLYYVNTVSGLIERVVSQEEGETVEAELSGWVDRDGEKLPMRIVWKRSGKEVMELNLTGATHIPRQ